MTADHHLPEKMGALEWGIVRRIEALGYWTEIFGPPRHRPGLASGLGWNFRTVDQVARRCIGGVVVGLPRWRAFAPLIDEEKLKDEFQVGRELLASEYCHYEAAVLRTLRIPLLLLAHEHLTTRATFNFGGGDWITSIPANADETWLDSREFGRAFDHWQFQLEKRRDVFLAYSSKSSGLASNVRNYLQGILQVKVLDWQQDFAPGGSIIEEISIAADRCSGGIFLFTQDDDIAVGDKFQAAPRDNVIFEAGYFAQSKGTERILIIREGDTKMPADLGGHIYATVIDKSDISPIEKKIRSFIENRL